MLVWKDCFLLVLQCMPLATVAVDGCVQYALYTQGTQIKSPFGFMNQEKVILDVTGGKKILLLIMGNAQSAPPILDKSSSSFIVFVYLKKNMPKAYMRWM